ncbi:hypothetical protein PG989_010973 [Apiospora arundinis]
MDEGVPPVPGPKLYPFKDCDGPLDIKFLKFLGNGVHALVWSVLINGKPYVLKVFNQFRSDYLESNWEVKLSKDEEYAYFDAFSCECRAYGRIREAGLEQYVARCYGYIKLARSDFIPLLQHTELLERRLGYKQRHQGRPFRAIVKEYVKTDPNIHPPLPNLGTYNVRWTNRVFRDANDAKHLIRGVKRLQKSGILVRDINSGNVMNGRLVDFSRAWTVPHPVLVKEKIGNTVDFMDGGYSDASEVDELIDIWNGQHLPNLRIWDRCMQNGNYCDKIRNHRERRKGEFGPKWKWGTNNPGWYIRPELYKWQADNGPATKSRHWV